MNPDDWSFVDANVLVYAATPSAPQYKASLALLESDAKLCVSPQIFAEFYSVVTNPRRVSVPFSSVEAKAFIDALLPRMEVLIIDRTVVERWSRLAVEHLVTGADIFDLQLAATMMQAGVLRIYTYNISDFERVTQFQVISP